MVALHFVLSFVLIIIITVIAIISMVLLHGSLSNIRMAAAHKKKNYVLAVLLSRATARQIHAQTLFRRKRVDKFLYDRICESAMKLEERSARVIHV